ncbi:MAG: iron-containing alcohol dehydrogenase [Bryobacteraceae bacterium]|nr:iron-containing alcohol dehydrogenase [Bryobacteraceae bacterium]
MKLHRFSFPTAIVFGPGAVAELPGECERRGLKRPLLVTDRGLRRTPVFDRVQQLAPHAVVFDAVDPNPTEQNVIDGVAAYRAAGCDSIIALGGGSPLDAGKAIRLKVTHPRPLAEYDDLIGGDALITSDLPPLIALATTSGTGSEVGRSAVITLAATNRKTVIFSPHLIAGVVLNDPELTLGLPASVTAGTGMDALTHNFEAYVAKGYHPICDGIGLAGVKLCAEHLPRLARDPRNLEARTGMMMASMMGAIAFQKGLGATHSLAHPLSSEFAMHHGTANAVLLPAVIDFNFDTVAGRMHELGEVLGGPDAASAIRRLNGLLGIAPRLRDYGIPKEALASLAAKAFEDGCHQLNPRPCTEADLRDLYMNTW